MSSTLEARTAVAGDGSAAAEDAGLLYERYYDRIFGYCLYHLGSREEAEDAAQTTFLWAFRGLRRGVVPRSEASWLFTIAQNSCRARHRTRGRRRDREVLSDPHVLQDLTAAPTREHEELVGLEDALARMPEVQRRAILLREWQGLSYREIAAELDLSGAAVETLIFRARRSLAELLSGRPAPKRARRFAFDAGAAAAALKALGAGTAAKVAVGIAAAVLAVTLAGSAPPAPQSQDRPTPLVPTVQTDRGIRPPSSPAAKRAGPAKKDVPVKTERSRTNEPKETPAVQPAPVSPPAGAGSTLGQTVDEAADSLSVVSDLAGDQLEAVTATLDEVVDSATTVLPAPVGESLP